MQQQRQLRFNITDKVEVDVDFAQKNAVIRCETEDGARLQLETRYETLEKIHQEIRKKLDT